MANQDIDLEKLIRKVVPGRETVFDVANETDDDGEFKRVSIGMRDLPPLPVEPVVAYADAREHVFHSLDQFGLYLVREAKKDSCVVLADVDSRRINAVLDESDEYDREAIEFEAKTHPLFEPWETLIGKSVGVLEFALHVMQYRSAVSKPDGRELALMFSQVKSSKSVTKRVGVGPKALNGVMIQMQIGSETKDVDADLPESITIDVPLFLDTDPVEVTLDLLVYENRNSELVVGVTAPNLEAARIAAFEQMVQRLRSDTEMIVSLGRVGYRSYRTVETTKARSDY
jgi:hypothetical protein